MTAIPAYRVQENPVPDDSLPVSNLLGVCIHRVRMSDALLVVRRLLKDGKSHQIITADASMLVMSKEDTALRDLINTSDLVVPDSTGVVWGTKIAGDPVPERVTGVDLMEQLCALGGELGLSAYFLGSAPGVAEEAARKLEARFPGFQVVGTHHGFLQPGDDEAIMRDIRALKPDYLFVAMGIPRQEKWIRERMAVLQVPISMGVGGSFDCHSGRVQRAPAVFQRLHIEWLYRLITNPSKYKKVAMLPRFVAMVLKDKKTGVRC